VDDDARDKKKRFTVSQEQKDMVQQQEVRTDGEERVQDGGATNAKETEVYLDVPTASGKKRKKRKFRERIVYESEISPHPSGWPIALAFSVALLLFGLIYNVYFLSAGVILVVVCILGWVLERQKA